MNDRYIALDTETTGLLHKEGDRLIEFGCVEVIGNMPTGKIFHEYINPGRRKVHPDALKVHNISDEFLRDKPTMSEVMPSFIEFLGDSPMVIHNAPFDMGFINNELELLKMAPLPNKVIDSLDIARKMYPMARNSLDGLCLRFGVDRSQRTYHGALVDADLLAQVYIHLMGLDRLDLGDHPLRNQAMNMAVETLIASGSSRPVRHPRPALAPNDSELERHGAFVDGEIKEPLWAKFF